MSHAGCEDFTNGCKNRRHAGALNWRASPIFTPRAGATYESGEIPNKRAYFANAGFARSSLPVQNKLAASNTVLMRRYLLLPKITVYQALGVQTTSTRGNKFARNLA